MEYLMIFNKKYNTLFLDMDGVLMDFDKAAIRLFGMSPPKFEKLHGPNKFWELIKAEEFFFLNLEPMSDMKALYKYCLKYNPIILTGIPKSMEEQYGIQKIKCAEKHFGIDQKIILERSSKKSLHCKPGDVIIDDRTKYKHLWEEVGGTFIVHTSAKDSIKQLKNLGI
jgi:hypothetical protein